MHDIVRNEKGIALVTSLMLTLISLVIVMGLLYMITQSTVTSAAMKKYRTALDASYGGADLMIKDLVPLILRNYSSANLVSTVQSDFSGIGLMVSTSQQCLQAKLSLPTSRWPATCSQDPSAKKSPDLSFSLPSTGDVPYQIYAKIIDTVNGNSDTSGIQLEGAGVAEGMSIITPMHIPYIYTVEIQGEQSQAGGENAQLSVLYAY